MTQTDAVHCFADCGQRVPARSASEWFCSEVCEGIWLARENGGTEPVDRGKGLEYTANCGALTASLAEELITYHRIMASLRNLRPDQGMREVAARWLEPQPAHLRCQHRTVVVQPVRFGDPWPSLTDAMTYVQCCPNRVHVNGTRFCSEHRPTPRPPIMDNFPGDMYD